MISIGDKFPEFKMKATVSNELSNAFQDITHQSYPGKWLVVFFWPKDFTFVCPTEIEGFADLHPEFTKRDAQILGASVDSEFVHLAWRQQHPGLNDLPFPMLADIKRDLSQSLGILHKEEGVPLRATYIVDPQGTIRAMSLIDLSVGRNPQEILRQLDALQTGELCPVNWKKGEKTLQVA